MLVREIVIPPGYPFYNYSSNFNPSIIQLSDNRYLVSFHTFRRYAFEESAFHQKHHISMSERVPLYMRHPWFGGPEAESYWQPEEGGYVGTGFLILEIQQSASRVVNVLEYSLSDGVDMRLLNLNNHIFGTHTSLVDAKRVGQERSEMGLPEVQKMCCELILGSTLTLRREDQKYELTSEDQGVLCQNLSTGTEKNWSTWDWKDQGLRISYHLVSPTYCL